MPGFEDIGVSKWLVRQARAIGLKEPTPVQTSCIPEILKGRDCVGCAKTGSGKTAAFAIPILQRLSEDPYGIFCVVLTPARELAYQIADQFRVLGKPLSVRVAVVVGGRDMLEQSRTLAVKPHIVIATPGRFADHLRSTDTCRVNRVQFLVLDESDRLMDESMADDLTTILDRLPKKRRTLLFSATIGDEVDELESMSGEKPFVYVGESSEATVAQLQQDYVLVPQLVRDSYLFCLVKELHDDKKKTMMVFTSTCKNCQILSMLFDHLEIPNVALHSLMSQNGRLSSISKFKSSMVRVLVATDLASRGLDIPTVEVVVNSNVPASPEDYIHRVGRTARAGRGGRSVTMVTQYEVDRVHAIEERTGKKLTLHEMDDDLVSKLVDGVTLARRQMELRLGRTEFGDQRQRHKDKKEFLQKKQKAPVSRGRALLSGVRSQAPSKRPRRRRANRQSTAAAPT